MTETLRSRGINGWTFLRSRRLSLLALIATLVMLILSLIQPAEQISWLYRDNGVAIQHLQIIYLVLEIALLFVFLFEPQIRRELREAHALGILALLSVTVCFLLMRLPKPDEAWRFFRSAGFLWWVIIHGLFLCALSLLLVLDRPQALATSRTRRYALIMVAIAGVIMLALHILSIGQFMGLDLNDEVWLGSLAQNYAVHNVFYSPYLAGAFGNPDPFLPRYYLLMGEWIRLLQNSSFFTLRAFSLLAAAAGVALTAWILVRKTGLTTLQRIVGLVVMIGLSPFVRTSHNVRMDAGLAFYGALLLLGLLHYFEDGRKRWLILCGVALIIGMEMIPPLALAVNVVIGLMLIGRVVARRVSWQQVILYAAICALSVIAYIVIHFFPDVSTNVTNYLNYTRVFYSGSLGFNFAKLLNFGEISAFLSPVEVILVILIAYLAARTDRLLLLFVVAAALLVISIRSSSYGYLMAFTPFIAYFAARSFTSQVAVTLGAFLLIPALLAMPIYDMAGALDLHANQRQLDEVDLLSWRVPAGSTVWAEPIFWITLHDKINYVGGPAPRIFAQLQGETTLEAAKALGIDVVICNRDDQVMCDVGAQLFGAPYEFNVTDAHYQMYSALGSK